MQQSLLYNSMCDAKWVALLLTRLTKEH